MQSKDDRYKQLQFHARLWNERRDVEWEPAQVDGLTPAQIAAEIRVLLSEPVLEAPADWQLVRVLELAEAIEAKTGKPTGITSETIEFLAVHQDGRIKSPRQRTLDVIEQLTKQMRSLTFADELQAAAARMAARVQEPAAA